MIVGLGHQARVGKDTAASILVEKYGFKRLAFADRLKQMALEINPMVAALAIGTVKETQVFPGYLAEVVDRHGWEEAKEWPEVRTFLQNLGVAARNNLGDDIWVRVVTEQIQANPDQDWVITDVRFPNEHRAIKGYLDSRLIKVTRPGIESNAGTHVSEMALADARWDDVIVNDGTIEDLERKLVEVLGLERDSG